jgi:hypothetical protein
MAKAPRKSASPGEDFDLPADLPPAALRSIGAIASDWAAIEFMISHLTWRLAGVYPALGACITAQIYTFNGRVDALIALLRLRQADKKLIADVNRFKERSRGPQELRNRIVHDAWTRGKRKNIGRLMRLEVTARNKLSFDLLPTTQKQLKEDEQTIRQFVFSFGPLRARILDALPTLPGIPVGQLELAWIMREGWRM